MKTMTNETDIDHVDDDLEQDTHPDSEPIVYTSEEATSGTQLSFEGDPIRGAALRFPATKPAMGSTKILTKGQKIGVAHLGDVVDVHFPTVKGATVRTHLAQATSSVLVDAELVQEMIDVNWEAETGQMRLLSDGGEVRRAARRLVAQSDLIDQLPEGDTAEEEFITTVKSCLGDALASVGRRDDFPSAVEYLERLEDDLVIGGAWLVEAVAYTRRVRAQLVAAAEAEARSKKVTIDATGTVLTEREAAEARGEDMDEWDRAMASVEADDRPQDDEEGEPDEDEAAAFGDADEEGDDEAEVEE